MAVKGFVSTSLKEELIKEIDKQRNKVVGSDFLSSRGDVIKKGLEFVKKHARKLEVQSES